MSDDLISIITSMLFAISSDKTTVTLANGEIRVTYGPIEAGIKTAVVTAYNIETKKYYVEVK